MPDITDPKMVDDPEYARLYNELSRERAERVRIEEELRQVKEAACSTDRPNVAPDPSGVEAERFEPGQPGRDPIYPPDLARDAEIEGDVALLLAHMDRCLQENDLDARGLLRLLEAQLHFPQLVGAVDLLREQIVGFEYVEARETLRIIARLVGIELE